MPAPPILVVGAGPTGLVLALRLARHGTRFRIVDARSGPGEASRAIAVHARTLEFYDQMEIADAVISGGMKAEVLRVRKRGKDVARLRFGNIGAGISPYPFVLCYPQDDHERFLVARLAEAGVAVEWNTRLDAIAQDDEGVTATLGGAPARFAHVCGCDGARSQVRESLGLDFPGGTYEQLFYVADVELAESVGTDICINLGVGSFALLMPVRSSGGHRLIGAVRPGITRDDVDFEDIRGEVEPLLGIAVNRVNWFSTYRVHHRVAAHFRVGRCFLAGDAGHIHSPAGGQGMNTGIGDAVNLAWKLAAVVAGTAPAALLDSYEVERIAFARTLVATTDRAFEAVTGAGLGGRLVRSWVFPYVLPLLTGFAPVRRAMFRAVSQVRINYRESLLSGGSAGGVAGGDRLPWAVCEGADNFAPLRAMAWQVHVYGVVTPEFAAVVEAMGVTLHVFVWCAAAERAGLMRDAAYLVRPDGYVALAQARQDGEALRAYPWARGGLT